MKRFLEKYGFKPDKYYRIIDGNVYRNVAMGFIKEGKPFDRAFRRVGNCKVYAVRFNTYTVYYVIHDDVVYRAVHYDPVINDMVEDLELLAKGYASI